MIDLSTAKVEDEFVDNDSNVFELKHLNKHLDRFCFECNTDGGLIVTTSNGINMQLGPSIVAKHEPVKLQDGEMYQFSVGGLINCLGMYFDHRKSFVNCGNKVCGATEAKDIVKLVKEINH